MLSRDSFYKMAGSSPDKLYTLVDKTSNGFTVPESIRNIVLSSTGDGDGPDISIIDPRA